MSAISELKAKIQQDVKDAMRARNKPLVGVLRMLTAAIKQREVDERISLADADILQVIGKMIKQRQESVRQFEPAGRQDLVDKEKSEIIILQQYLPAALTAQEIDIMIAAVMTKLDAKSVKDMGRVMAMLRTDLQGRADMGAVSAQVKSKLV